MVASCSVYPRLLHVLIRTLGIIKRNLLALIAPVIDVADPVPLIRARNLTLPQCLWRRRLVQKMDLGACPKSHTERLKTEYLAAKAANPSDPTFSRFQKEYEANIFQFVDECDRRIRAAHRRLEKTPEENAKTTNLVSVYPWYRSSDVGFSFWPQPPYLLPFTFWKLRYEPNTDFGVI